MITQLFEDLFTTSLLYFIFDILLNLSWCYKSGFLLVFPEFPFYSAIKQIMCLRHFVQQQFSGTDTNSNLRVCSQKRSISKVKIHLKRAMSESLLYHFIVWNKLSFFILEKWLNLKISFILSVTEIRKSLS